MATAAQITKFSYNPENLHLSNWMKPVETPQKRGRQGYLVRYYKDIYESATPWSWELVTQNGVVVASSDILYSSRGNARRSVQRIFNGTVAAEETVEV